MSRPFRVRYVGADPPPGFAVAFDRAEVVTPGRATVGVERVDCVVATAERGGLQLTERLAGQPAAPPVVVVAESDRTGDGDTASPAMAATDAGAAGYVRLDGTDAATERLVAAVVRAIRASDDGDTRRQTEPTVAAAAGGGTAGGHDATAVVAGTDRPSRSSDDPSAAVTGTDRPSRLSDDLSTAGADSDRLSRSSDDPSTAGADTDDATDALAVLDELHAATRRLMRATTPAEVAATATAAAGDVLGFGASAVRLYDPETDSLVPAEVSVSATAAAGERPAYTDDEAIHWEVLASGECRYYDDVSAVPDDVSRSGGGSVMYLPLGAYGVFSVGRLSDTGIDPRDRRLARLLAANTTAALAQADNEETLREREAELAARNDRLEEFAAAAAHDLRNPLSVVAANLELARGSASPDHDPLAAAADAVARTEEIVDSYLRLARQGRTVEEPEPTELATVARAAADTVETGAATVRVQTGATVAADPERLRTLFENLYRNAVEHAGEGVTITVTDDPTGFRVRDDGPGFGETDPEELFAAGAGGDDGLGLGLTLVSRIAEAHGWTVTAGEADDGGALFRFQTE